jgi:hypothetical protein
MAVTVNFNSKGFELFMEILPSIQAIFKLGFIPLPEEIQEFDESAYAMFKEKTGRTERPLYTIIPSDDELLLEQIIEVMFPDDLPKIFKGINFFIKYAKTHKILINDRQKVFNHAIKNAPDILKTDTPYESPQNESASGDVYNDLMEFLSAGLDKEDIFSMKIEDERGEKFNKTFIPAYTKNVPSEVMSYEEFKHYIINALSQILINEECEVVASVSLRESEKPLDAIHAETKKGNEKWSNGFLVEPYYEEYKLGRPLGEMVLDMLKSIEANEEWINKVNISDLNEFETSKNSLFIRLLNYEANKKLLEQHVYRIVGDMALVVYMFVMQNESGMSSYKINADVIKKWNLSDEYVINFAIENTAKMFTPYVIPMEMFNFTKETAHTIPDENRFIMHNNFSPAKSAIGVYNLFQEDGLNAATIVFYKGAMQKLASILNDDLYITLPESDYAVIHEKRKLPAKQMKKIFKRIKSDPTRAKCDLLSEKIYLYTRSDDNVSVFWE